MQIIQIPTAVCLYSVRVNAKLNTHVKHVNSAKSNLIITENCQKSDNVTAVQFEQAL